MNTYFFQLGNTPDLSLQELESILGDTAVERISDSIAQAQLDSKTSAQELIEILGGTVKIFQVLHNCSPEESEPEQLHDLVFQQLKNMATQAGDKLHFALSELGRDHLPELDAQDFKSELQKEGIHARYVEGSRHGLSAAVLLHKKRVQELCVIQTSVGVALAKTVAIQDIDDWSHKDRSKPYADRKKGMLPPKVALMMVNIAVGDNPQKPDRKNLLLDPFCGTGTAVIEGLLAKLDVVGSDNDPDSVAGSTKNLDWIATQYKVENEYRVFISDATKVPPQKYPVQYIVTEPFLGKPKPNAAQLPLIFKGLEKLYLGAFKNWTRLLADGASVVIVFPLVEHINDRGKKSVYSLTSLIDKLTQFGYTMVSEPIMYRRPQAVVQRQIYRFIFKAQDK